jgi:hypothetical protein
MEFGMEQESDITELPARSDLRLDNPTDLITDDEEIRQGVTGGVNLRIDGGACAGEDKGAVEAPWIV